MDDQGLDGRWFLGSAVLHLTVVGEDGMFQQEQGLVGEADEVAGGVANHVASQDDVTNQGAVLRIFGLDRMII